MIKKTIILFFVLILAALPVLGHTESMFEEAAHLIEEGKSCSELTEDQLVLIGDYVMEQHHPGEAHIRMDEMHGGEGSESLRAHHLYMAERFYCDDYGGMGPGMMYDGDGDYRRGMYGWNHHFWGMPGGIWIIIAVGILAWVAWSLNKK